MNFEQSYRLITSYYILTFMIAINPLLALFVALLILTPYYRQSDSDDVDEDNSEIEG